MYEERQPPQDLATAVRCVWRSRDTQRKTIVPDGCLDLVVSGDHVFVAGPDTLPWHTELPGSACLHGIRFRPGQAPRVLGAAADELCDQRIPLTDLWPRDGALVTERLLRAPGWLPDLVRSRLTPRHDPELQLVLARIDAGAPRVDAALADIELGRRQLRRRFSTAVGYGPATYLRVARFRRAVALEPYVRDLSALAARAGYADQAHLSRDTRELTGATPGNYFALCPAESPARG